MPEQVPLTVYFDGSCPLCRREIAFYQRRRGADAIRWVDISEIDGDEVRPGLSHQEAMARFHVEDAQGQLYSGGKAFAVLWTGLPAFRIIGRIAQVWPLSWALELGYRLFLPVRPHLQRFFRARDTDG